MTATREAEAEVEVRPVVERRRWGALAMKLLTTTDHKVIGNMYFVTSLAYFVFAGLLALVIRAELAFPGLQFVHYETFNQFFTMHGTLMLLMFATPMFVAFANAIMPLQIGAPDVAFPRLNAFSLLAVPVRLASPPVSASSTPGGAASFGWFAYVSAVGRDRTAPVSAATCGSWACT